MSTDNVQEAVEVLQELGLKEYEARCFVGLARLSTGTAKELGEVTDVPRTRVYDAIRVLEAQGLVEIQHTSPQQFRAVPLEEATETLREQYEGQIGRLSAALDGIDSLDSGGTGTVQEVWSLTGRDAIATRTNKLVEGATDEVVLVIGDESLLTPELADRLNGLGAGTDVFVGAATEPIAEEIRDRVPNATTFHSGLAWIYGPVEGGKEEVAIGRLLLVDRSKILVSSIVPHDNEEHAVFGTGFGNGLVVIARRLMAQGLQNERDVLNPAG